MKPIIKAAVKVQDMTAIVLHDSIVKAAGIKDGELFTEQVTDEGILLKRVDTEDKNT
jgi:hypothetical protein